MTQQKQKNLMQSVVEQLIDGGTDALQGVVFLLMNQSMQVNREEILGAASYQC